MGSRIAEVHEQPITQILREVAVMALNDLGTGLLILAHELTQVFGVELGRQRS
jgi:hypothetical protein